jgi:uracil-DNA glycosylase
MKKKLLREQALEYLQYLKEQGLTHVPASGKRPVQRPAPQSPAPPSPTSDLRPLTSSPHPVPPPLQPIVKEIAACQLCPLAATRQNTVPGQGALQPDIMFIGEGPGADEDEQGLAFVGRAGQLLTKMITAMGYTRERVFIGNIVKCRPPGNRVPTPDEMAGCLPYLKRQIAIIQPKLIVCLGATAARGLVQETLPIGKARGHWREFEGIPVMLTFHPAYLLRDPRQKVPCWADLKAVLARLGKTPPAAG